MKNKKISQFIKTIEKPWLLNSNQNTISYRFIKKLSEFCFNYLPRPIRKKMLSFLHTSSEIITRFITTISQLSYTAYLIEGKEKNSKAKLKILYLSNEGLYPYLMNLIFSEKTKYKTIDKIKIWNIHKKIKELYNKIDAVFIESNTFYAGYFEKQGFIIIPESISMTLDISESFEKLYKKFSKSAKEDIRKVKRYKYKYEITQNSEKLKLFYYKMYHPYISQRHKEIAVHANFHAIRILFEKDGRLMLIKHKNEYVSGAIFSIRKEKAIATYLGIKKEKTNLFKKGLTAASYYFFIKWAKENNIKKLDFGTSKAFLNDGLFRYKKKWGTTIDKTESCYYSIFPFKICKKSKGMQIFVKNNPFVYLEKNQLRIMGSKKE